MAANSSRLYVTNAGSATVSVIGTTSNLKITDIAMGDHPITPR